MPDVLIEGLCRTFPGRNPTPAVSDVSLTVAEGQILALLGPSGCGKTTTLRCIAGLEEPDEGLIRFGGRVVFDSRKGIRVPAHRRDIGLVFQSYALWPHMTAYRNIEFPLRSARLRRNERAARVEEVASTVDLDPELLEKRPGQLSGGQQQRVALARALVGRPSVILFDEPLSNLDANLRAQLRSEIHSLHQRLGFTGVYVTHDLSEALALGDHVAIMSRGRVAQHGSPLDVFERPRDASTARLLGFRRLCQLGASGEEPTPASGEGTAADLYARPDRLRVVRAAEPHNPGEIATGGFRVHDIAYLGDVIETTLQRAGESIQVRCRRGELEIWWQAGDEVSIAVRSEDLLMLDASGEVSAADIEGRLRTFVRDSTIE